MREREAPLDKKLIYQRDKGEGGGSAETMTMNQKQEIESEVLEEVINSIRQIKYGEVVIVVHNSKIVQIEKREKRRFQGKGGDAY